MAAKVIEILGVKVKPGESIQLNMDVARLHTRTSVEIPVIIERALEEGPTLLLIAGIHGDEINGVEILRRVIRKGIHKPDVGTVICIPVFNIFGFLNLSRKFPDGRDLNRVFPGSKNGSLAGRLAWLFMQEIAPVVDYVVDFHTGGADRFNYPQVRCTFDDERTVELAKAFDAPLLVRSAIIGKSIRSSIHKMGKPMIVYEGGKTLSFDEEVIQAGIKGIQNVMTFLGQKKNRKLSPTATVVIEESRWIRSHHSGLWQPKIERAMHVQENQILGYVTGPYGDFEKRVVSPTEGFVFAINTAPIVNRGDALFHLGLSVKNKKPTD